MFDIGIDLGTTSVIVYMAKQGIVMNEPSVIAIRKKTGQVLGVGSEAFNMIGKANHEIAVIKPIKDGVISDYKSTEIMIKYFVDKICKNSTVKPRIILCVPSGVTNVESDAVIDIALSSGARKVYLIEEPVAAAIGAGMDISKPNGNMVIDIGGGTTDIAVLSLNGIASKTSIKVAGNDFDNAIVKYIREKYNIIIGERTAQNVKKDIGSLIKYDGKEMVVKGKNTITGMPSQITVKRMDITPVMISIASQIVSVIPDVLERTLPDLTADILSNGICLTGGGALLDGICEYIEANTKIKTVVAEDAVNCVAKGTGMAFDYLDKLFDGFVEPSIYSRK